MTAEHRKSLVTKIANPHRMGPVDARPAGNREIASNEKGDGGGLEIEMEVIAMELLFQDSANAAQPMKDSNVAIRKIIELAAGRQSRANENWPRATIRTGLPST